MAAPHVAGLAALCLGTTDVGAGPCAGRTPAQVIAALRDHAAARAAAAPLSGFAGDPSRPLTGRIYGPLAWAPGGTATPPTPPPGTPPTTPPVTPPTPSTGTPIAPASLTVGTGTNPRGTAAALAAVDGTVFALDSTTGVTPLVSWTATFTGVPATQPALAATHTGTETRPCTRELSFLRWRDGAWLPATAAGTAPTADVRSAAGEVRVRVRCTGSLRAFTAATDALLLAPRG